GGARGHRCADGSEAWHGCPPVRIVIDSERRFNMVDRRRRPLAARRDGEDGAPQALGLTPRDRVEADAEAGCRAGLHLAEDEGLLPVLEDEVDFTEGSADVAGDDAIAAADREARRGVLA